MPLLAELWLEEAEDYSNPVCMSKPVYMSYLSKHLAVGKVKVDGELLVGHAVEESLAHHSEELLKKEAAYLRDLIKKMEAQAKESDRKWRAVCANKEEQLAEKEKETIELRRLLEIEENKQRAAQREDRQAQTTLKRLNQELARQKESLAACESRNESLAAAYSSVSASVESYQAQLAALETRCAFQQTQNAALLATVRQYEASMSEMHQMSTQKIAKEMRRFDEYIAKAHEERDAAKLAQPDWEAERTQLQRAVEVKVRQEEKVRAERELRAEIVQEMQAEFAARLAEETERLEETYKEVWVRRDAKAKEENELVDQEFRSVLTKMTDKVKSCEQRLEAAEKEKVCADQAGSEQAARPKAGSAAAGKRSTPARHDSNCAAGEERNSEAAVR